jgi:hypothetical protein
MKDRGAGGGTWAWNMGSRVGVEWRHVFSQTANTLLEDHFPNSNVCCCFYTPGSPNSGRIAGTPRGRK